MPPKISPAAAPQEGTRFSRHLHFKRHASPETIITYAGIDDKYDLRVFDLHGPTMGLSGRYGLVDANCKTMLSHSELLRFLPNTGTRPDNAIVVTGISAEEKANTDKAKAEADKAKAEAEKARAEADKAKAEAEKARAETEMVKIQLWKAKADTREADMGQTNPKGPEIEAQLKAAEDKVKAAEAEAKTAEAEAKAAKAEAKAAKAEAKAAETDLLAEVFMDMYLYLYKLTSMTLSKIPRTLVPHMKRA